MMATKERKGFFDLCDEADDNHSGYSSDEEIPPVTRPSLDGNRSEDSLMKDSISDSFESIGSVLIGGSETKKTDDSLFGIERRGFFSMPPQLDERPLTPSDDEFGAFSSNESTNKQIIENSSPKEVGSLLQKPSEPKLKRGFFDVTDSDAGLPSAPVSGEVMGLIQMCKLPEHYDSDTLKREFSILSSEDLKLNVARQSCLASQHPDNVDKNRYTNIPSYDVTRVCLKKLEGQEHSDYINANWISGIKENEVKDDHSFIATQGPIPLTYQDFWRMVWETNAKYVVFLGREIEKGMLKVDHYWPDVDPEKAIAKLPWEADPIFGASHTLYGSYPVGSVMTGPYMTITAVKEELIDIPGVVKRTFLIAETKNPDVKREVYQFQYGGWPDNGAPSNSEPIRNLVKHIRTARGNDPAPIIIHCSAGVGRTGAFCTIYTHVQRILHYVERQEDKLSSQGSPVKKSRDEGTGSSIETLQNSGTVLKNNLTGSQRIHREDSCSCNSPSSVSPLEESSYINDEQPLTFNIFETVLSLRKCRSGMVQNLDQYMFCYKAIIDELRLHNLLPSGNESDSEEEESQSEITVRIPHEKVKVPAPLSPTLSMKLNPFPNRQSLLTSIDIGYLNTSPSQKPPEPSVSDAEFHPCLPGEGSSQPSLLTRSTLGRNGLSSSAIQVNPLLPDSRRLSPLRQPDSVHSAAGRSIPIRPRVQPLLQHQSPTLIARTDGTSSNLTIRLSPTGTGSRLSPTGSSEMGSSADNDGSLSDDGSKKERVPPCNFLTRSAINPSTTLMSTSAPAPRNPILLGRSPINSPSEISSPA